MSKAKHLIYGYLDPRNGALRYVGKSSFGLKRPKRFHLHSAHCLNWINSLAKEGLKPTIVILEEFPDGISPEHLNAAEVFNIAFEKYVNGCDLTNLKPGGEGPTGWKHSPDTIVKMRAARDTALSDAQRLELVRLYDSGLSMRIVGAKFGIGSNTVCKILRQHGAVIHPKRTYTHKNPGIPVRHNSGVIFKSIKAAAKSFGIDYSQLWNHLHGFKSQTHGHSFSFVNHNG